MLVSTMFVKSKSAKVVEVCQSLYMLTSLNMLRGRTLNFHYIPNDLKPYFTAIVLICLPRALLCRTEIGLTTSRDIHVIIFLLFQVQHDSLLLKNIRNFLIYLHSYIFEIIILRLLYYLNFLF